MEFSVERFEQGFGGGRIALFDGRYEHGDALGLSAAGGSISLIVIFYCNQGDACGLLWASRVRGKLVRSQPDDRYNKSAGRVKL